ncbi:penicillin-binding protein 1A [Limisalsivibrio acetivorans]|uniref:penicillin-binding protein 1A n=1 Tax=Limisalsivibrio acetivorans TaxID=1304888 RepID=UPI0003B68EC3|nr:PBP1A family penicillin-binding protein [Limisalsivibrio acetivorans]
MAKKIALITAGVFLLGIIAAGGGVLGYIYKLSKELPSVEDLKNFEYPQPTIIYDRNGETIAELGSERRYPVPVDNMTEHIINAIVAVEDARFYEHGGVDLMGILRAFITNMKAGRVVEGGSTLTQQLVKEIYLTRERKLRRKVKEAILAYKLDNYISKEKILELYLNYVYFGRGAYGVEAAAVNYFGKSADNLTLPEAAMIAGLPKSPGRYPPHINPERALQRRDHVLYRMFETGYITEEEYNKATDTPIEIVESIPPKNAAAGYFTDFVIKYLKDQLDIEDPENTGMKVYTTLDLEMQAIAETAAKNNLIRITKELGYTGPVTSVDADKPTADMESVQKALEEDQQYIIDLGYQRAVVTDSEKNSASILLADGTAGTIRARDNRWAKPREGRYSRLTDVRTILDTGDVVYVTLLDEEKERYSLEQIPELETGLISADPATGEIYAMVGGFDYRKSMFNRSVQAKRQVGSLFKPIVYSTALETEYEINTEVFDAPVVKAMEEEGEYWKPENYSGKFFGLTTLKEALTKSRNIVTIKVAEDIGIGNILRYAQRFGLTEKLERDLSTSIGSGTAPLIEMVFAFSVFPNLGHRVEPLYVTKVEDINGEVIAENEPSEPIETIRPATAQIMTDMMRNVVEHGTGRRAKVIPRPIGGKTGTTNDFKDTWFVGYMPNLVNGVWVGFDDFRKIGNVRTGSNTALPAWVEYTKNVTDMFEYALFPVSDDVVYKKIDTDTRKITDSFSRNFHFEPFDTGKAN